MIEIIPALPIDIPTLRRISIETQVDTFGADNKPEDMEAYLQQAYEPTKFEREFFEPKSIYYIAWEGKEAAGFLRLRVTNEAEEHLGKNAIELQRLYVTRNFQGKKIGFQLMQKAIDHSRHEKFEWLWLGVWERNTKAQEFYKKIGFEYFASHIFWMGPDPQNDWLMKLKL
jgi:ribosomal protein S18 acetylase RimI-like enzyme